MLNLKMQNDDISERMTRLTDYIVYEVMQPEIGDHFIILDPFLDPYITIFKPFEEKKYDDFIWSKIINEICALMEIGEFRILTKQSIKNIYLILKEHVGENYPVSLSHPEFPTCPINIAAYLYDLDNVPHRLHDRWIIKRNNSSITRGLHIGSSLNDINEIDVTITPFDENTLRRAIERFDQIWDIALHKREL